MKANAIDKFVQRAGNGKPNEMDLIPVDVTDIFTMTEYVEHQEAIKSAVVPRGLRVHSLITPSGEDEDFLIYINCERTH